VPATIRTLFLRSYPIASEITASSPPAFAIVKIASRLPGFYSDCLCNAPTGTIFTPEVP
jgi:hypothetical protein